MELFCNFSNGSFILGGIWHGAGWTFVFWGFLHGIALVIHRAWSNLGFKIWTWLAWLITFNFINIAWVFFRAKEWDDALKVLGSMFSLDNIVLPNQLASKLAFLSKYNIEFGGFLANIQGDKDTVVWLITGFILILFFRNSMEKLKDFNPTVTNSIIFIIAFTISFYKLSGYSEFLYFRF